MAELKASYNDDNSLIWLKGKTSDKNYKDGVSYTVSATDFNSYVDNYILDYSSISEVKLYFTATKTSSISNGDFDVYVNGSNVYTNDTSVFYATPLNDSVSIIDYIYSGVKDAGKVNGDILLKITSNASTSIGAAEWIIKNLSIEWIYTPPTYVINLTQTAGGTISQSGNGMYNVNSSVTLTATPDVGYRFVRWSDGNENPSRTITVTTSDISYNVTNYSFSAVFEKIYVLTVNVNNASMAYIEMNKNGVVVSGNSVEYSISDIASFRVCANKGYILSNVSVTNNTDSTTLTLTADQAYTDGYLNDSYTIFTWKDMTINESMLGMEVNIELEFIAGSKIYTLTVTTNDNSLGDITLYKNDTVVNGNVLEGVFSDKLTIMSTANDNSFINSVSDGATLLDRNTLISSNLLDDICKQLNLSIEVKEPYIGNKETLIINFTPGVNMYFAGKKAIELYYEGNLFSGAYFEGNKL